MAPRPARNGDSQPLPSSGGRHDAGAAGHHPAIETKSHPVFVGDVVRVVRIVVDDSVDHPTKVEKPCRYALPEASVEEELRRLV